MLSLLQISFKVLKTVKSSRTQSVAGKVMKYFRILGNHENGREIYEICAGKPLNRVMNLKISQSKNKYMINSKIDKIVSKSVVSVISERKAAYRAL